MPHDKNGKELHKGDAVTIAGKVTEVHQGADYCNVTIETDEAMHPGNAKSIISLNSKQVAKKSGGTTTQSDADGGDVDRPTK
jgi:hypothetical protein